MRTALLPHRQALKVHPGLRVVHVRPCAPVRAAPQPSKAEDIFGKLRDRSYLDAAAKRFALGEQFKSRFKTRLHRTHALRRRDLLYTCSIGTRVKQQASGLPARAHVAVTMQGPPAPTHSTTPSKTAFTNSHPAVGALHPAIENDIDEDEFVAMELGPTSGTEIGQKYRDKIKEKLKQRAAELKAAEDELRAKQSKNFVLGKEAYE